MVAAGDPQTLDFGRALDALRRRKRVVIAAVLAMVAAALGVSLLQTPLYQAEARILMQTGGEGLFDTGDVSTELDPELLLETQLQVLGGDPVMAAVRSKLGPVPKVKAERIGQSLLVAVKSQSPSPQRAADVANEYARSYVALRRDQAAEELRAAGQQLQNKLAALQAEIDEIEEQIASAEPGERVVLGAQLERRDALVGQHARFREKLDEIEVEASLASGGARIAASAAVPVSPVQPQPVRNSILAGTVGLLLGLGAVSLLEYFDGSVRTKEDVSRALGDVPVLGVIPAVPRWKKGEVTHTPATERDAPVMEAFRSLRTSLQLLGVERPLSTLQITSPNAGDGKTTTLVNLAVLFAGVGQRVVLLDCDLRRPRLHEAFGLSNSVGFTSVFADSDLLSEAMHEVAYEQKLTVVPSGPIPTNPSEMLASKRTSEVIYALQSEFDLVLVDSPPVLPVTDATVMSSWVEGTLLVVSASATTRSDLDDAMELLRLAEAPVVGAVLNRATSRGGYGYGGYLEDNVRRGAGRRNLGGRTLRH